MTTQKPVKTSYDVVVVGGGPAGTTFAHLMKNKGHDVLLVERARHPRFSIGESLLPATMPIWQELGLHQKFEEAGFIRKYGAYFDFHDGDAPEYFHFPDAVLSKSPYSYEVPRAEFDKVLWDAALDAGVHALDKTAVRKFEVEGQRVTGVTVRTEDGEEKTIHARLAADCSGRASLLGRQLGIREKDEALDKVALFTHYRNATRSSGDDEGTIAIIGAPFGWMWLIPFAGDQVSVGAVVHNELFSQWKKDGWTREQMWDEIISTTPTISCRVQRAERSRDIETLANFSYRCKQLAGDGWVLIGDAGAFLDPVFSSGVHLAMSGAKLASRAAHRSLRKGRLPRTADFRGYQRRVRSALNVFSKFIYAWYDPNFRASFMRPPHHLKGVGHLKRHIIAVLAGDVFQAWRVLPPIGFLLLAARMRSRTATPELPAPGQSDAGASPA